MKKGKFLARRMVSAKTLTILLAVVLVVGCAVGGTLAWLVASTDEVKNTFTAAGIDIELKETMKPDGTVVAAGVTDWSAKMIPGYTYSKNPVVTVTNDVSCYLFVKFDKKGSGEQWLDYKSLEDSWDGWCEGNGTNGVPYGVFYRIVNASDTVKSWHLIKDDKITIKSELTKENMPATGDLPELIYTAYVCQLAKNETTSFTVGEAWAIASGSSTNP